MYTAEEFDKLKQKVLKYIFYKKRTEQEIRQKFQTEDYNMMEDMVEFLKEQKYINDTDYIIRSINEFKVLKNLSLKEIKYKLYQKGLDKAIIEDYFNENYEELYNYELKSAKNIFIKKSKEMEIQQIKEFLFKKGYMSDIIKQL
ncbi:MAG: RecX family transcriptional regulator [Clostridia bacterium]|nr:RecX family transcriptional regulator [Clostridia bacterium]